MSVLKRWMARARSRTRAASPRAKLSVAGLAVLAVAGGAWLAVELGGGEPAWPAVLDQDADPGQHARAVDLAIRHGIAHRIDAGRLVAPPDQADRLRRLLAAEGSLEADGAIRPEDFSDDGDIWRTPEQLRKRWEAMNMARLSRLIGQLPKVRRAAVLIDAGARRGLGRPAVAPTAAVQVTIAEDERMTARLASAIADLVVGSIAGMRRDDVRIVNDAGKSWRVGDDTTGANDPLERLREAEDHYRGKVHAALAYIDNPIVGVCVAGGGGAATCLSASVSVPRSYLASAYRAAHDRRGDPNDIELENFAEARLGRIARTVAGVTGIGQAERVKVDWYDDAPVVAPAAGAAAVAPADAADAAGEAAGRASAAAGLACLGALSGLAALCARRRGRAAVATGPAGAAADASRPGGQDDPLADAATDPLRVLAQASAEQVLALVEAEQPQTVALVLAHVEPAIAAAVLEGLPTARQVEVTRRIARLGPVDPELIAEAVGGLVSGGLGGERAERPGGPGRVARILYHAGSATEKAVLDEIHGEQPDLAESIRKRMFAFEDVALLPRDVLKVALESLGTDELAIALRTAGKDVKEKVLSGVSRSMASKIEMEMERIGPVRLSDVEVAQERVVAAVRRMQAGRYVPANVAKAGEVMA